MKTCTIFLLIQSVSFLSYNNNVVLAQSAIWSLNEPAFTATTESVGGATDIAPTTFMSFYKGNYEEAKQQAINSGKSLVVEVFRRALVVLHSVWKPKCITIPLYNHCIVKNL